MLHQSPSNPLNRRKYCIIIPLLVIFTMSFNIQIVAQNTDDASITVIEDQQNILKFVITKNTKNEQLDFIKDQIESTGSTISFKSIKRNSKDEITAIKIQYNYENQSGNYAINASDPIDAIEISINPDTNRIAVKQQTSELSQTFEVETIDALQKTIISTTTKSETNKILISTPKTTDTLIWHSDENNTDLSDFDTVKNSPLFILDGKEISPQDMEAIETSSIASIIILKDENVTEKYGEKGKNGVVVITSKKK